MVEAVTAVGTAVPVLVAFEQQEVRVLRHDVADWRKASEDEAFRLPAGYEPQWDPIAVIDEIIVNPQSAPAYCDTVICAVAGVAPALADKVKRSELVTGAVRDWCCSPPRAA